MSLFSRLSGTATRFKVPAVVGNGVWTLSAKIVSQAAQLATFIVAARVLSSAEFGFFAYSSALAILLSVFAEGGWGEFVMKMKQDRTILDQIATVSIASGGLAMSVGFCVALVIHFFFLQPTEAQLICVFSVWLLFSPLSAVCDGRMIALDRLRAQSIIRIAAEVVGLCVVVGGLWLGWNVFALVAGRLVMQVVSLAAAMVALHWLPRLHITWTFLIELLDFSRHILLNRVILFLRSYSGTIIVGSFLGLAEAGYYRAAERIVAAFSELIGEPARILAWSVLRRAAARAPEGETNSEIGKAATMFLTILMAICVPVYVGLALTSDSIVHFALGDAWAPVALLVSILALKQILLTPGFVTESLLSLSGTIRNMPLTMVINSAVMIAFLLASAPFGVVAIALGHCAASVVSFAISMRLQSRYGAVMWNKVLRDCLYVAVALAAMVAGFYLFGDIANALAVGGIATIVVQIATAAVIYIGALALIQKIRGPEMAIFHHGRH
jgi:O-antigen/teichoic acid export membrane protein